MLSGEPVWPFGLPRGQFAPLLPVSYATAGNTLNID